MRNAVQTINVIEAMTELKRQASCNKGKSLAVSDEMNTLVTEIIAGTKMKETTAYKKAKKIGGLKFDDADALDHQFHFLRLREIFEEWVGMYPTLKELIFVAAIHDPKSFPLHPKRYSVEQYMKVLRKNFQENQSAIHFYEDAFDGVFSGVAQEDRYLDVYTLTKSDKSDIRAIAQPSEQSGLTPVFEDFTGTQEFEYFQEMLQSPSVKTEVEIFSSWMFDSFMEKNHHYGFNRSALLLFDEIKV